VLHIVLTAPSPFAGCVSCWCDLRWHCVRFVFTYHTSPRTHGICIETWVGKCFLTAHQHIVYVLMCR